MRARAGPYEGVLVLRFEGGDTLDAETAPRAKAGAIGAIDGAADVVVDLSEVEFIDSAGLGALVGIYKAVRSHGRRAAIVGVRPGVLRVMRLIKLDRVFDLRPDVDSALAALRVHAT